MSDTSKFHVLIAIGILWSVVLNAQQSKDCTTSVRISPDKGSYVFQEPIRLNVTLSNVGSEPATLSLISPYFNGDLVFSSQGEPLVPRDEYSAARRGFGGKYISQIIEHGRTLEFTIFFQTYYPSLAPGRHTLRYAMDVPCESQGEGSKSASSSGTFPVLVEPEDQGHLRRIITNYSEALDRRDSMALRALLSMDTPPVIPELKTLLEGSNWEIAFQALSRFRGNPGGCTDGFGGAACQTPRPSNRQSEEALGDSKYVLSSRLWSVIRMRR